MGDNKIRLDIGSVFDGTGFEKANTAVRRFGTTGRQASSVVAGAARGVDALGLSSAKAIGPVRGLMAALQGGGIWALVGAAIAAVIGWMVKLYQSHKETQKAAEESRKKHEEYRQELQSKMITDEIERVTGEYKKQVKVLDDALSRLKSIHQAYAEAAKARGDLADAETQTEIAELSRQRDALADTEQDPIARRKKEFEITQKMITAEKAASERKADDSAREAKAREIVAAQELEAERERYLLASKRLAAAKIAFETMPEGIASDDLKKISDEVIAAREGVDTTSVEAAEQKYEAARLNTAAAQERQRKVTIANTAKQEEHGRGVDKYNKSLEEAEATEARLAKLKEAQEKNLTKQNAAAARLEQAEANLANLRDKAAAAAKLKEIGIEAAVGADLAGQKAEKEMEKSDLRAEKKAERLRGLGARSVKDQEWLDAFNRTRAVINEAPRGVDIMDAEKAVVDEKAAMQRLLDHNGEIKTNTADIVKKLDSLGLK